MEWTGDGARPRLPLSNPAEVSAYRRYRIETIGCSDDVYLLVLKVSDRTYRIQIGIAGMESHRRLKQSIWREILVSHDDSSQPPDTHGSPRTPFQPIPPPVSIPHPR